MRDRNNKGNANDREWTTMKKIFSLFLICTLAFSTLSNMIVSAESKSTGTLTIHKFEQSKELKQLQKVMEKKDKLFQKMQNL